MQRLTVHQFHDSFQAHDAISNQMRFVREALKEGGIGGEIFARHLKGASRDAVRFSPTAAWNCDLLLIHHSQGSPWLNEVLRIEVPKALVYHNITPSEYFAHDPYIQKLCLMGRRQLLQLRRETFAAFADSEFNGWELEALGFAKPLQLPLLDLPRRQGERRLRPPRRFLFVGKLTPHKNQALILKTFFYLERILGKDIQLELVGGHDPVYARYLKCLAKSLKIDKRVRFHGKVTEEELETHYRLADAFLSTSLHEGFCIPLVEAMRFQLPLFALPTAAVPETLGVGGVRLCSRKPHRIAEIIAAVLEDAEATATVIEGQNRRYAELTRVQSGDRVRELVSGLLQGIRGPRPGARKERTTDVVL